MIPLGVLSSAGVAVLPAPTVITHVGGYTGGTISSASVQVGDYVLAVCVDNNTGTTATFTGVTMTELFSSGWPGGGGGCVRIYGGLVTTVGNLTVSWPASSGSFGSARMLLVRGVDLVNPLLTAFSAQGAGASLAAQSLAGSGLAVAVSWHSDPTAFGSEWDGKVSTNAEYGRGYQAVSWEGVTGAGDTPVLTSTSTYRFFGVLAAAIA